MENYDIIHKLAAGAFGTTYEVIDRKTSEKFAMKCIPRGSRIDDYVRGEILNHRVLQHPNVIQFKEVVLDDFKLGIVMALAEGGDLAEARLLGGVFSETKARTMFQQLIAGVSYIHSKGICHRDLKLNNVLFASDGLKICDFGLSKLSLNHSKDKSKVGTPAYCAPEIINEHDGYDGKVADVWSCGVLLYNMLKRDNNVLNTNAPDQTIAAQCEKLSRVSKECKQLLLRMLDKDPKKRITIQQIKEHSWYLMNLPEDLTEEKQAKYHDNQNMNSLSQSEEDINNIIEAAKTEKEIGLSQSEEDISNIIEAAKTEKEIENPQPHYLNIQNVNPPRKSEEDIVNNIETAGPVEETETSQAVYPDNQNVYPPRQSKEDTANSIEAAKTVAEPDSSQAVNSDNQNANPLRQSEEETNNIGEAADKEDGTVRKNRWGRNDKKMVKKVRIG